MANIGLLSYNNYYNRTIRKYETLSDYFGNHDFLIYNGINFFKSDGVGTRLVLNDPNLQHGPVTTQGIAEIGKCDYLIEFDNGMIISRWFVIESKQIRNGQYELTLRRDVIADHMDEVLDADTYIEKANVPNVEDVAIYNQEDLVLNQIKTDEYLLKDETRHGWIVGYYDGLDNNLTVKAATESVNAIETETLEGWEYREYVSTPYKTVTELDTSIVSFNSLKLKDYSFHLGNGSYVSAPASSGSVGYATDFLGEPEPFLSFLMDRKSVIDGTFYRYKTDYKRESISGLDGKVLHVLSGDDNGYYSISVTRTSAGNVTSIDETKSSNTSMEINAIAQQYRMASEGTALSLRNVSFGITYDTYLVSLTRMNTDEMEVIIPNNANALCDAPYKMFAIPYGMYRAYKNNDTSLFNLFNLTKEQCMNLAAAIATAMGTHLYDIQLLPYLPWRNLLDENGHTHLPPSGVDLSYISVNSVTRGFVLYPPYSNFSFDISYSITLPDTVTERKVVGQCDNYRLISPNHAAVFEFNPLKTNGVRKFNVDCTYKPHAPYIHINPDFGGLYGSDFNDIRGLIFQGDFSLPIVNSAWIQYQINNKNYLNSFNRSIDSVELHNRYARIESGMNAAMGTVQGAMTGAALGGVAGAIGGAVASGIGGAVDYSVSEKLRNEALDLTRDQFNYSLGNIQAMPRTLAKVSSFDYNNKVFPVLEHYTCTDREKEMLRDKMRFNGMKIMRIGHLRDFISDGIQYMKGQVIRLNVREDTHMCNEIANEIYKGVYL